MTASDRALELARAAAAAASDKQARDVLVIDVSDPLRPKEVGCFVPELSGDLQAVQSNDIGTDDDGRLYLIDRAGSGTHILEYTG